MSDVSDALRGEKLAEVRSHPDRRSLSITAGGTVRFAVDADAGSCLLRAEVVSAPAEGDRIFEDGTGAKIVRFDLDDERASLHLEDGTIFHVLAVVNEDGCRVATREEREHARGVSSLLDRLLGRVR